MTLKRPTGFDGPGRLADGAAQTPDELAIAALVSQLPAATPDDLAVERVWRRVLAPAERSARPVRPLWIPAAALGVLLLVGLGALGASWWRKPAPAVELALSSGGVFSSKQGESWRAGQSGESLAEAEWVRTDTTGQAVFRIRGVAAVLLSADSDVGLERLSRGTFLRLSHGTLTARVSKRKADEPFVVQTDRYAVKVVGTLFTVEQGPGDHTAVSVREGIVEVSDGLGLVARVVAGQRWTSESTETRTPDRTSDAVKTLLEEGLQGRPAVDLAGDFVEALAPPAKRVLAPSSIPEQPVLAPADPLAANQPIPVAVERSNRDRPHAQAPAGNAAVAALMKRPAGPRAEVAPVPVTAPPVVAVAAPAPQASAVPAGSLAPSVVSPPPLVTLPPAAPAPVAVAPPPPPSANPLVEKDAYAQGLELQAKGDFKAAAKQLARAADWDPLHGDIALYALGRLAQRQLHDAARARSAFSQYRQRFPRGPLLPEVDLAMLELEVETHARADALADSTRFLAVHPGSERVEEVHLLRANLLRDSGSCREALDDYANVRSTAFADEAVYSTAYCRRKLGDRSGAAQTLRDYLARFPNGAHRSDAQQALAEDADKSF